LEATSCTYEQKVTYTAFKLFEEAKRWWQERKMLLAMEMGMGQVIPLRKFKDKKHIL
jgi:hypothetical protein